MARAFLSVIISLFVAVFACAQQRQFRVHTIAFYNVENLFDTINGPGIGDDDYLPWGREAWTGSKYKQKLANIAQALSDIGSNESRESPAIIGLCEIENRRVLEDLVKQQGLLAADYGIVHFDSPDSRGTDVALLYRKKHFRPTSHSNIPLIIKDTLAVKKPHRGKKKATAKLFTRDQLLVTGLLDGEEIHFIVNHWPSRYGGEKRSSPNREAAAALNRKTIDSLFEKNPQAKVITMGDFNDGPYNNSIQKVLRAKGIKEDAQAGGLFNPMEGMFEKGNGSVAYRDAWDLFDQIIVSGPLLSKDYATFRYWKAGIFNPDYLTNQTGRYKTYPLRNANGEVGYSDHFPVYLYLIREEKE